MTGASSPVSGSVAEEDSSAGVASSIVPVFCFCFCRDAEPGMVEDKGFVTTSGFTLGRLGDRDEELCARFERLGWDDKYINSTHKREMKIGGNDKGWMCCIPRADFEWQMMMRDSRCAY